MTGPAGMGQGAGMPTPVRPSIGPAAPPPRPPGSQPTGTPATDTGFRQALDRALAEPPASRPAPAPTTAPVRFSGHAQARLAQCGRTLTADEVARVSGAVDRAASKGSRDALILMPDLALVVSVPNRTVITAVTQERLKDNVFTQIDAAVLL